jgi:tetratricopeptide (TPR) repeat protein
MIRAGLLVLILAVAATPVRGQDGRRQARALFEEAQKYQLGVDRPVNIQKAFDLYLEATRLDPRHRDAFYNLAGLCFQHKRYDLAGRYYRAVIELDPRDGDAYNNMGSVYEKQGHIQHARRLYAKAIQVDSTVAVAHYNMARMLFREGRREAALAQLKEALRYEPDNPVFVSQSARLEGEMGKISRTTVVIVVGVFVVGLAAYALVAAKKGGLA